MLMHADDGRESAALQGMIDELGEYCRIGG